MNDKKMIWGHIVGIITVLCWGGTFINTKYLIMGGLKPHEIFFLRFLIAYICIWFISPRRLFCNHWKDEALMVLIDIREHGCGPELYNERVIHWLHGTTYHHLHGYRNGEKRQS